MKTGIWMGILAGVLLLLSGCKDAVSSAQGACEITAANSAHLIGRCEVMTRSGCADRNNSDQSAVWTYRGGGTRC